MLALTLEPSAAQWAPKLRIEKSDGLPRIERVGRQGAVLRAGPFPSRPDVLSLNIARGCVHRCAFCSIRAYASYPGDGLVYLYRRTSRRLVAELESKRSLPGAVYISPSTDPFPPIADFQRETATVVETLAQHGVEAWLVTRGYIRPSVLKVLAACRDKVKVIVGLTTLDRKLQRILEPLTAPPRLRLRQIARLRGLGIAVQVALEPLVPGLTDTPANLSAILEALAALGVRHVSTGYMFLRHGIRDNLAAALAPHGWDELVLTAFADGRWMKSANLSAACYLPKAYRQRGYAALMALAAPLGITVSISGVTNPDLVRPEHSGRAPPATLAFSAGMSLRPLLR